MKEKRITTIIEENPFLYHLLSKKITKKIKAIHGIEYPILMICLALDIGQSINLKMNKTKIRHLYRSIFTNQATDKAIQTGEEQNFLTIEERTNATNPRTIELTTKGAEAVRIYKEYTYERVKEVYLSII